MIGIGVIRGSASYSDIKNGHVVTMTSGYAVVHEPSALLSEKDIRIHATIETQADSIEATNAFGGRFHIVHPCS